MKEIVFLLEEESARAMLSAIMPRLMGDTGAPQVRYVVFEGKRDLARNLERKLRGYLNPQARFIVLTDQDQRDCKDVKKELVDSCRRASRRAVVRIACRELEAFYLGDLDAVEAGLGITGVSRKRSQARFREPDSLRDPSEELARLTKQRYQKVSGSRAIAPHLNLDQPGSPSFRHLLRSIRKALARISHEHLLRFSPGEIGAIGEPPTAAR